MQGCVSFQELSSIPAMWLYKDRESPNSHSRMNGSKFKVINARSSIWKEETAAVMMNWSVPALTKIQTAQVQAAVGGNEEEE